ncbi:hypothetical protein F0562_005753 [Nyssa sinensis]|uniref:Uncharacterized protein n=1 Tax=Nyssa sinensis TaxID=561372 RepID=A0A5J5ALC2_9ASTE|nr:hypothetical protein F0562_005753 [Nyssa sinensis]
MITKEEKLQNLSRRISKLIGASAIPLGALDSFQEEKEMDESDNSEKSSEQLNKEEPEEPAGSPPNNSHTICVNYEPPSTVEMQVMSLYKAVYKGDLEYTKLFIEQNPDLLTAKLSTYGDTALHIAALAGHAEIVKELVNLMP